MMIRSRFMAMVIISSFAMNNAQAVFTRDAERVTCGTTVFSGVAYWVGASSNAIVKWGAAGAVVGSLFTTYSRSLWAQLNLALPNKQLMNIVSVHYENEADLIAALEQRYVTKTFPLVVAFEKLSYDHGCLVDAINTIDGILDELSDDSSRAHSLKKMRDDAFALYLCVEHTLRTLKKDPRWTEMVAAKNAEDSRKLLSAMQYQVGMQYHWYPQPGR